jgi:hypothetical protein
MSHEEMKEAEDGEENHDSAEEHDPKKRLGRAEKIFLVMGAARNFPHENVAQAEIGGELEDGGEGEEIGIVPEIGEAQHPRRDEEADDVQHASDPGGEQAKGGVLGDLLGLFHGKTIQGFCEKHRFRIPSS